MRGYMDAKTRARGALILSMLIFGTIGVLRRYIPLPSGALAFFRGATGAVFLWCFTRLRGGRLDRAAVKANLAMLCVSGAFIGFNWILLFEAYSYTSIAAATLCYYMAPIIVILASPLALNERLTGRRLACAAAALAGVTLVSGVTAAGFDVSGLHGALLGLGAAAFYACVILMNKKISGVQAIDRTMVQLAAAAAVVLPYALAAEQMDASMLTPACIILTLVAGVVHTGFAYAMYFASITRLSAHTAALFSYIDPIFAVVLSAVALKEPMDPASWLGAALVLGATLISELPEKTR